MDRGKDCPHLFRNDPDPVSRYILAIVFIISISQNFIILLPEFMEREFLYFVFCENNLGKIRFGFSLGSVSPYGYEEWMSYQ